MPTNKGEPSALLTYKRRQQTDQEGTITDSNNNAISANTVKID